jgi:hypothetical protein
MDIIVKKPRFEVHTNYGFGASPKHKGFEFPDDYREKRRKVAPVWLRHRRAHTQHSPAEKIIENAVATMTEQSHSLLALPEDWDGEGAVRIAEDTRAQAIGIFERALNAVAVSSLSLLLSPRITAMADGSIDVRWKSPKFTLLINISPQSPSEAKFYAVNNNRQDIRGPLKFDAPDFRFLNWLVG